MSVVQSLRWISDYGLRRRLEGALESFSAGEGLQGCILAWVKDCLRISGSVDKSVEFLCRKTKRIDDGGCHCLFWEPAFLKVRLLFLFLTGGDPYVAWSEQLLVLWISVFEVVAVLCTLEISLDNRKYMVPRSISSYTVHVYLDSDKNIRWTSSTLLHRHLHHHSRKKQNHHPQ